MGKIKKLLSHLGEMKNKSVRKMAKKTKKRNSWKFYTISHKKRMRLFEK